MSQALHDRDDVQRLAMLRATPRNVVLVGNYGSANLGDEMLLRVVAGWVKDAGGEPVAISVRPSHTERTHGVRAVDYADAPAIAAAIAATDLVVMGGGGLFQDYNVLDEDALGHFPAFEATQFAQYALMAATLGVPYVALAQGVGPLRSDTSRRLARHVFASANAVSLRDEDSAALLRAIGCEGAWPVAPDPGWTWQPARAEPIAPTRLDAALAGQRVVAMVVREWPYDADWEERFVAALRPAWPNGWAGLWIDFHRDPSASAASSSPLAERMRARLPGAHAVWRGEHLEEVYGLIAGCDAVIAMRLHGALLGYRTGRPTATLEYDAKVAALAREAGVPTAQRVPLDAIGEHLPAAIAAITGGGDGPAFCPDAATIDRLAERALAHRTLLWQMMANVAARPPAGARRRWLAAWARDATASAPGFVDALEGRLHRALDRHQDLASQIDDATSYAKRAQDDAQRARQESARAQSESARHAAVLADARGEIDRLHAELAQSRAKVGQFDAALADAVRLDEHARAEAAHWRARVEAIEQSRSYRWTAPLRRLAAGVRAWRGRTQGGGSR